MKYEKIKSAILIFLVLFSIILTWNLWTYQPNFETMQNSKYVAEVSLSEQKELKKIVKPDRILFHVKGKHYGSENSSEMDRLLREMSRWEFTDVKNYTDKAGNIKGFTQRSGTMEIIFPGRVPIEIYRNILTFEQKRLPAFNFDRIIINMENPDKANGTVYFVSSETQQVYSSHVAPSYFNDLNRNFYKNALNYPSYFAYNVTEKRTIFLPEKETQMMAYKYLPVTLNSEKFKEALFSDPSIVRKNILNDGEEYTDGSSKMNIDYNNNMLLYVNPTEDNEYMGNSYELMKRSIDFVNEHGGWTDLYRYVSMDEMNQKVTFRLYSSEGYPVFNERGMSEITEVWGRNEINKYVRPNIALELPIVSETVMVTRASGHDVLSFLQKRKNFKPSLLGDMVLGYKMKRDEDESRLILLEPTWYYRYNKTWGEITMEDLGGLKRGLE
ncbi:two-component system activity regulator YycH [Neobacillus sp. PS3-34]|uniref:YycH family regulatory protein n=1 Tax=Neobacillus sp. PS3-34 TaxID=3070678 RepID=UPI0027DF671A|nr:two-component system activity regulator YycH [Neobacillus sp. PS3-34]WML50385.1 two-component system activity regulator YycH [Neobacillus sp. PS3-34]